MGSPPRGEVLMRGDPVFASYHKDPVSVCSRLLLFAVQPAVRTLMTVKLACCC